MAYKMEKGNILRGLILRNEKSNENYDTDFLYRFVKYSDAIRSEQFLRRYRLGCR